MRAPVLGRGPESARVWLDVREDIRAGREPLARIVAAADRLPPDTALVVQAPFEPIPLYAVLARRGLAHRVERRAPGDWIVLFYRDPDAAAAQLSRPAAVPGPVAAAAPAGDTAPSGPATVLDVRGLEAPLPMLRVLEAVEGLAPGERLEVLHARRPVFLYPQLEARGLGHRTDEPEPGTVRIVIWRGEGA